MKEKYKNNIAYLFKKLDKTIDDNTDLVSTEQIWSSEGIPFYCNKEMLKRSRFDAMANTYKSTAEEVLKTTTQINFQANDRISFTSTPRNDVNNNDFSVIISIDERPYMEKGNKYRTVEYKERWLTIS